MKPSPEIDLLFEKYLQNRCTPEEAEQVLAWLESDQYTPEQAEKLRAFLATEPDPDQLQDELVKQRLQANLETIRQRIGTGEPAKLKSLRFRWIRYAAAALLLLALGVELYKYSQSEDASQQLAETPPPPVSNDALPGGDKAILTLAGGEQIVLDQAANGELANQGNAKVIKLDGLLTYDKTGNKNEVAYHTISTPAGGQYQLVLADGSKVWLNAASSLRFPTSFPGKDRQVELTGEGYFEIARKTTQPFTVTVKTGGGKQGAAINVLGTHFNINAYDDESAIKTTLLEGSVKLASASGSKLLKPNQQGQVSAAGNLAIKTDIDIDQIVAWKNGLFNFNNSDLELVMRQISRWYGVEVVYEGLPERREFGGEIQRNLNLSQVLKLLETNDVHFKIEGKKLIVKP